MQSGDSSSGNDSPMTMDEALDYYKQTLEESVLMVITDEKGKITFVNKGFCKLSGYSAEELKGKTHRFINSGRHPASFFQELWESITRGKVWEGSLVNKKKDGSLFRIKTTIYPFVKEKGKPYHFMALSKTLEETAPSETPSGEDFFKDRFLSQVGHELRTPLNSLAGLTGILKESGINEEQRTYLEKMDHSVRLLSAMIDDLLLLSRMPDQPLPLELKAFSLKENLNNLFQILEARNKPRNIATQTHIDPNIPGLLLGDAFRVNQILITLAEYFLSFTQSDCIKISANLERIAGNHCHVLFSVEDVLNKAAGEDPITEEGLTPKPFAIAMEKVNAIIKALDGEVIANHGDGESLTYEFSLPLHIIKPKEKPSEQKKTDRDLPQNLKVLVAEDVELNQFVIRKHLEKLGLSYDFVKNGYSAIEKLKTENYNLILMDMQMPIMDGLDTIREIRKDRHTAYHDIPIIAFTASISENAPKKCLGAGADDYLPKPYNVEDLKEKIFNLVSSKNNKQPDKPMHKDFENNSSENGQKKLINLDYLNQLSEGDHEFSASMISYFIDNTPETLESLEEYYSKKDWKALRNAAHKFKPQLTFMGIHSILEDVEKIEQSAYKEENLDQVPDLIQKTKTICLKAIEQLREELEKLNKQA